jgi:caffeoyl-CoA O-methyltransferase
MFPLLSDDLDTYINIHSSPESVLLKQLAEETRKSTEKPHMMIDHSEGLLLRILVRLIHARRVLELGTFTGYSALTMAEGLPDDGEIITCDVDPVVTKIAQRYWDLSPHGSKINLLLGPAIETIESVQPPLDMIFLDADKENYVNYWEAAFNKHAAGDDRVECVMVPIRDGLLVAIKR